MNDIELTAQISDEDLRLARGGRSTTSVPYSTDSAGAPHWDSTASLSVTSLPEEMASITDAYPEPDWVDDMLSLENASVTSTEVVVCNYAGPALAEQLPDDGDRADESVASVSVLLGLPELQSVG